VPRAAPGFRAALLVVDMINTFEYEGGDALLRHTRRAAPTVRRLRDAFHAARLPVVYCNDNFGRWRSDFRDAVRRAGAPDARGADVVALMRPGPSDYFVLKPRHSAFYDTPLALLLRHMRIRHLVLAGIAGDGCIAATALDAHTREYEVTVARDATASRHAAGNRRALELLRDTDVARLERGAVIARALRKPTRA